MKKIFVMCLLAGCALTACNKKSVDDTEVLTPPVVEVVEEQGLEEPEEVDAAMSQESVVEVDTDMQQEVTDSTDSKLRLITESQQFEKLEDYTPVTTFNAPSVWTLQLMTLDFQGIIGTNENVNYVEFTGDDITYKTWYDFTNNKTYCCLGDSYIMQNSITDSNGYIDADMLGDIKVLEVESVEKASNGAIKVNGTVTIAGETGKGYIYYEPAKNILEEVCIMSESSVSMTILQARVFEDIPDANWEEVEDVSDEVLKYMENYTPSSDTAAEISDPLMQYNGQRFSNVDVLSFIKTYQEDITFTVIKDGVTYTSDWLDVLSESRFYKTKCLTNDLGYITEIVCEAE